ncbi:STAS domain-containing protein [Rhodobacter sp. NSM]|uniref:STAS domain-containing protein n=1 Tax=Rhodobacter sp. NSM TaxID=3457501 RepID=UPI003FD37973
MTNFLELPTRLDHKGSRQLYAALLAMQPGDTCLSAGKVVFVGGLALQILISAASKWRAEGFRFSCHPMSPAFADDIARMGVDPKEFEEN